MTCTKFWIGKTKILFTVQKCHILNDLFNQNLKQNCYCNSVGVFCMLFSYCLKWFEFLTYVNLYSLSGVKTYKLLLRFSSFVFKQYYFIKICCIMTLIYCLFLIVKVLQEIKYYEMGLKLLVKGMGTYLVMIPYL